MSATTGKSWKIARYSGASVYNIDGIPSRLKVSKHTEQEAERGTGQRRLVNLQATNIYWDINFRIKLQKLVNYIVSHCFVTAEGDLPSHSLYVNDGIADRGFTSCLVDRCEIEIGQRGSATADITAITNALEAATKTVTYDTDSVITKTGFTTVQVGSTTITKWSSLRFAVENNIARVPTGTGAAVSEVYARSPVYNGRIELVKVGSPLFGFDTTVKQNVIHTIVDNQGSPVTKTFTFTNAAVNENAYHVEELDLTYETLSWTGDRLTIS